MVLPVLLRRDGDVERRDGDVQRPPPGLLRLPGVLRGCRRLAGDRPTRRGGLCVLRSPSFSWRKECCRPRNGRTSRRTGRPMTRQAEANPRNGSSATVGRPACSSSSSAPSSSSSGAPAAGGLEAGTPSGRLGATAAAGASRSSSAPSAPPDGRCPTRRGRWRCDHTGPHAECETRDEGRPWIGPAPLPYRGYNRNTVARMPRPASTTPQERVSTGDAPAGPPGASTGQAGGTT